MTFGNYINTFGRKLIITDSVSGVNKIVRSSSRIETISGVEVLNLSSLVKEILLAYKSIYEPEKNYKLISRNMQSMRLTILLKNKDISFLSNKSKNISTSEEILNILDQIRMNVPSEYFESSDTLRIKEIRAILKDYEAYLKANDELDEVMALTEALAVLEVAKGKKIPKEYMTVLCPKLKADSVGTFFLKDLNFLEKKFIEALSDTLNGNVNELVKEENKDKKYEFFKSYGISNEIRHIRETIQKENMQYGNVAIVIPSENYEKFVMAELGEAGIPFTFSSGFRASTSDFVWLLLELIDFASSDFEYKRLYNILNNPVIRIKNAKLTYKVFLNEGIGYGRQRYEEFFKAYENSLYEDDKKAEYEDFYTFLKSVIRCFKPGNSCEKVYKDLITIARNNTDKEDKYRNCVKDTLNEYAGVVSLVESTDMQEILSQIKTFLTKLKCSVSESPEAVNVIPYGQAKIIDRDYIFAVGLSNENVASTASESPVLCDADLQKCVNETPRLALERNKLKREAFIKTIDLSMAKTIYYSYSYYDTISLLDGSPAIIYLEALEKSGLDEKKILDVGYEICNESLHLLAKNVKKKDEDVEEYKKRAVNFSATSLQNLIHCPTSFYYERILRLPQIVFSERQPDRWLQANVKGNIFHHVLDKYVQENIAGKKKTSIDEEIFNRIFEDEIRETIQSNPIPSTAVYEIEREESFEIIHKYIEELHKELETSTNNKKIIGCEVAFEKVKYSGGENDKYTIEFRGSVDRLDGYVDENNTLWLQIFDYKTGSLEHKINDIAAEKQIQHHVYALAMQKWSKDNKSELEELFECTINDIKIESIQYVFPFEEEKTLLPAEYLPDDNGNAKLPESTEDILKSVVALYQKGEIDKAREVSFEISSRLKDEYARNKDDLCKYCAYREVCRLCVDFS